MNRKQSAAIKATESKNRNVGAGLIKVSSYTVFSLTH